MYRELYRSCRLVVLFSVVVTFDKTSSFQICFAFAVTVESAVPAGICVLTLVHAWTVETKEIPTLELRCVVLKLNTAPRRAVEVTVSAFVYAVSTLLVSFRPTKVVTVAEVLKYPQK